jgi:hypothetical protein
MSVGKPNPQYPTHVIVYEHQLHATVQRSLLSLHKLRLIHCRRHFQVDYLWVLDFQLDCHLPALGLSSCLEKGEGE